jgi:hypothetical protein
LIVIISVRSASVEVIEALVAAGADPDSRNLHSASVSPLTLVILRGAASTSTGVRLIGVGEEAGLGLGLSPPSHRTTADGRGGVDLDNVSVSSGQQPGASGTDVDRTRVAGRRVWIRAAEMLIKCGESLLLLYVSSGIVFNEKMLIFFFVSNYFLQALTGM